MAFELYKRGQGKNTRLWSAFAIGTIVALGCWRLYGILEVSDSGLWIETMVPAGVFVGFGLLMYWLLNKPVVADFLIAAEGELKKVSWSSRKEIVVSTLIVIVVVIVTAALLGMTDLFFSMVFTWLLS